MSPSIRALLGALLLVGATGAARAELVGTEEALPPMGLVSAWRTDVLEVPMVLVSAAAADSLQSRKVALAARSLVLPAAAPPSLWTFVTAVQAQQSGTSFQQLDTRLKLAQQVMVPTQVPLPGPLWLLVVGLLGLVGSRLGLSRPAHPPAVAAPAVPQPA